MHPIIAAIQQSNLKKVPEVKTGYTVKVSQKVTEGAKDRIQHFEGLVIKISSGAGVEKTFTVRKIVEGIGVEKVFPFHSPTITKIHVIKKGKVRRQKLYYMRERSGKSARLSETHVTDEDRAKEEAKMEALYLEAIKAEEKRKKDGAPEEVDEVLLEAEKEMEKMPEMTEEGEEMAESQESSDTESDMAEVSEAKEESEESTEEAQN